MPREKRQQILLLILAIILFIGAIWFFYPRVKPILPAVPEPKKPEKLVINFGLLEDPKIKELQPFEEIKPFEGEIGRENPFLPY